MDVCNQYNIVIDLLILLPLCTYTYVHICISFINTFSNRISYIVYVLEKIKSRCSGEQQVLLLYDVACMLKHHLQVCMYTPNIMYVLKTMYVYA